MALGLAVWALGLAGLASGLAGLASGLEGDVLTNGQINERQISHIVHNISTKMCAFALHLSTFVIFHNQLIINRDTSFRFWSPFPCKTMYKALVLPLCDAPRHVQ